MHQIPDPKKGACETGVWLLHYPLQFFETLVDSALSNLRTYLLDDGIDPYES